MSSTKINLGKVALTPKGEWNATTTYERLDVVSYQGSSYTVLKECIGQTPSEGEYYSLLASKGAKGDKGDSFVPQGGTVGQILSKKSATEGDTEWIDPPETGVTSFNGRKGVVTPSEGDYTSEMVGAAPENHTHTPASIGAAEADHNHDDLYYVKTEVDHKLQMKVNGNLFDNWYFLNPIKQRKGTLLVVPGQDYYNTTSTATTLGKLNKYYEIDSVISEDWVTFTMNGIQYYARMEYCTNRYTADGYFIDRWMMYRGESTLTDDGVVYKWNGESTDAGLAHGIIMRQALEPKTLIAGQTITISFLLQGRMLTFTTIAPSSGSNYVTIDEFNITIEKLNRKIWSINLSTTDTKPVTVIAAKLELGDQQTLAHKEGDTWVLNDPPPNKALELTKCQRYQITMFSSNDVATYTSAGFVFAYSPTTAVATIYVPTNLRTAPAVKFNSCDLRFMSDGNIFYPITSMTVARISGNAVKLNIICSGGGLTTGEIYLISKSEDGFLIFDANL